MKLKIKNQQGVVFLLIASSLFLFINLKGSKNMIAGISDTQEKRKKGKVLELEEIF